MFKRARKRKIVVLLLMTLIAFMLWISMSSKGISALAWQRTSAACNAADQFLQQERNKYTTAFPKVGERRVTINGSGSGFSSSSGGEGDVDLQEEYASYNEKDPEEPNYEFRIAGRVGYVVNLSRYPVIEIYHSIDPEARELATRMLEALGDNYSAKIVSTTLSRNTTLNAKASDDGEWIIGLSKYAPLIIAVSALCIATILVWSHAEYTTRKRFNALGSRCRTCGCNLTNAPDNRCLECGTLN